MKKLLLFDIDGTLITSGGAGEEALRRSLLEKFGIQDDLSHIEIPGATDSGIANRVLDHHGILVSPANVAAFLDGYLHHLRLLLPGKPGRVLPGILPLLEKLRSRSDLVLALLTGNLVRGAEIKLTHYGLWHFFEFGAFADDHHDRNQLGNFAKARALEKRGIEFPAESIYVIGDTPRDIACGKACGAKTVAIATGGFSSESLAAHDPDYLFADLADTDEVIRQLGW